VKLIILVGHGEMSAEDVFTAFSYFLTSGIGPLALWDLSDASLAQVEPESLRTLAGRMVCAAEGRRLPGKAAVVCGRPVDLGKVHLLSAYLVAAGYPVEIATFNFAEAAMVWLRGEG
jgi:hypothetical protein